MAYSGTVGQTTINVQTLIDHGARRCGKLAEELTSEQQLSARESLFFLLSNLGNIGINYWAINKTVIGLKPDQYIYTLPDGAIDVLNGLYRTMTRPTGTYTSSAGGVTAYLDDSNTETWCQQTSPNGSFTVNFGLTNTQYIGSIGILPYVSGGGSTSWTLLYEYSLDGVTWSTLNNVGTVTVTDDEWLWTDIDPGQQVAYYRVSVSGGGTLALREWYLGTMSTEIPLARLNRDDYTNLPNKNFTANNPYQFWFNRTVPNPSMYLWPTPSSAFVQMTVWYSRQIMDVGALTDEIEVPQRWYEAIVMMLSHRMSLELPGVPLGRVTYLENQAEKYLYIAEQEERDKSPMYFAPNISVYTG